MITPKLLREWEACWYDEQIKEHFGRRKSLTPREVAEDKTISGLDRLWVLTRCLAHLDESAVRGFAIECALSVAHLAPDEDEHRGILGWLLEIEDLPEFERAAAYYAACSAASDAASDAASYAASDAARSAAYYAAWNAAHAAHAACSAASYAAYDAARSAAYYAARSAASYAASDAARSAASDAAYDAAIEGYTLKALEWLGDYADGGFE